MSSGGDPLELAGKGYLYKKLCLIYIAILTFDNVKGR